MLGIERKKCLFKKTCTGRFVNLSLEKRYYYEKFLFEKAPSVTYERYRLFNRSQESGKIQESLHVELNAQSAKPELGTFEDKLVRDLYVFEEA